MQTKLREHPIRKARHAKGLSLAQVGEHIGVSKGAVWSWERGGKLPEPAHALKLGDLLGLSLDTIYTAPKPSGGQARAA